MGVERRPFEGNLRRREKRRVLREERLLRKMVLPKTFFEINKGKIFNVINEARKKFPELVGIWVYGSATMHNNPRDLDYVVLYNLGRKRIDPKEIIDAREITDHLNQEIGKAIGIKAEDHPAFLIISPGMPLINFLMQRLMSDFYRDFVVKPQNFIGAKWAKQKIIQSFELLEQELKKLK